MAQAVAVAPEAVSTTPMPPPSPTVAVRPSPTAPPVPAPSTATPRPFPGSTLYQNGVVTVVLSSTCVRHGERVTASITGPRRAMLSMFARYRDGDPHGNVWLGETDPQGRYDWTFVVPPQAPPGPTSVFAATGGPDRSEEGGGIGSADFTVVGPTQGCP